MDWFSPIDLYCERVDVGLWAEPVNALSNLAFPLAALWAWHVAGQHGQRRLIVVVLCLLAALIGVGSGLFHSFANAWSEYADVVPIWSFVALYVLAAIALVGGAPPGKVARIGVISAAITTVAVLATSGDSAAHSHAADPLNGSLQYAPALVALLVFAAITFWRGHAIRRWALAAAITFLVSLGFRIMDLHLCSVWPMGTHFMWHVLNALMVALLLQGLIRCSPAQSEV
ncbi:ceramidase domain-containing protein [uncultured Pelagimonas sp.]|uniref:ceramidase domain-containing protein n=1 Tax=uncultured Pelagimonas sp. TaxID=1618102 RepID=UPI00260C9EC4|nr:ceramidase domain-containing protein [uncultured Pelagimonas sp.]